MTDIDEILRNLFVGLHFDAASMQEVFSFARDEAQEVFQAVEKYTKRYVPEAMTEVEAKLISAAVLHIFSTIGLVAKLHQETKSG